MLLLCLVSGILEHSLVWPRLLDLRELWSRGIPPINRRGSTNPLATLPGIDRVTVRPQLLVSVGPLRRLSLGNGLLNHVASHSVADVSLLLLSGLDGSNEPDRRVWGLAPFTKLNQRTSRHPGHVFLFSCRQVRRVVDQQRVPRTRSTRRIFVRLHTSRRLLDLAVRDASVRNIAIWNPGSCSALLHEFFSCQPSTRTLTARRSSW